MHPGQRPEQCQRAGHVVAVADVGDAQALERSVGLSQREQVGERLARVMVLGQHVDHRHRAVLRQLLEQLIGPRPHADRGDMTREHDRGVAHRLAAGELELIGAEHHRLSARIADPRPAAR